jgi:hypothetical protein
MVVLITRLMSASEARLDICKVSSRTARFEARLSKDGSMQGF